VAPVTGATSGIGRATAEALTRVGAKLVLGGRQEDRLAALAETLPDSLAVTGDMTDPALPGRLVEQALAVHGRLDLRVNNAGSIGELDLEAVCRMARINVEAAYRMAYAALRMAYAALRHFRGAGSGHLINISSVLGTKIRSTAGPTLAPSTPSRRSPKPCGWRSPARASRSAASSRAWS
jgi:NADP-dependent 3-hydroxy acid dehydrogenase YdfG